MLLVKGVLQAEAPCIVQVDPYVPISLKTYRQAMPGIRYFRIGNFHTSLLEIGIDPQSLAIRKVCLVALDNVLCAGLTEPVVPEAVGLPIIGETSLHGDRTDVQGGFSVCLWDNAFAIDWTGEQALSRRVAFHQVSFFLAGDELQRIVFSELTACEMTLLKEHLSAAVKSGVTVHH